MRIEAGPDRVATAPDGLHLYITHPDRGTVTVLDKEGLTACSMKIGGMPTSIAATHDGRLFVVDPRRGMLMIVDSATGASLSEIRVGRAPRRCGVAGRAPRLRIQ